MKIKICRQIDKLGRFVIPADLRKQYGLKPGDKVCFSAYDNGILINSENYNNYDTNEKREKFNSFRRHIM